MSDECYIIVGNDGFPRFADAECTKLLVAKSYAQALDTAEDMVAQCPYVIFGIYALKSSVFHDGRRVRIVTEDD